MTDDQARKADDYLSYIYANTYWELHGKGWPHIVVRTYSRDEDIQLGCEVMRRLNYRTGQVSSYSRSPFGGLGAGTTVTFERGW